MGWEQTQLQKKRLGVARALLSNQEISITQHARDVRPGTRKLHKRLGGGKSADLNRKTHKQASKQASKQGSQRVLEQAGAGQVVRLVRASRRGANRLVVRRAAGRGNRHVAPPRVQCACEVPVPPRGEQAMQQLQGLCARS